MYIPLVTLHGLVRGTRVEMGRDADTGGQVRYVLELAKTLAEDPRVDRVDVFTRRLNPRGKAGDADFVDASYSVAEEALLDGPLAEKCRIVRLPCGDGEYVRKEELWPLLGEFADAMETYLRENDLRPQYVHGHYADAGLIAEDVAGRLGVPFVFSGHSLGRPKLEYLLSEGWTEQRADDVLNIRRRIAAERTCLSRADLVVASTDHERRTQYGQYAEAAAADFAVIPPGTRFDRFRSFRAAHCAHENTWADRFAAQFKNPGLPIILSVARPDRRKNIPGLLEAFGESDLRGHANLVVLAGTRDDIAAMGDNERAVLTELLLIRDKHELDGHVLLPKRHRSETDVPALYRLAARSGGVFVNSAFIELFGLTAIEAAACGLPFVATEDGGPAEIARKCGGGVTLDVTDRARLAGEIRGLLTDRPRWEAMSRRGEECVRKVYSWRSHASAYLDRVSNLTAKPKAPAVPAATPARRPAGRRLVFCDIDGVLHSDPAEAERLRIFLDMHPEVELCMATGRSHASAVEAVRRLGVGEVRVWVTCVGGEVRYAADGEPDAAYEAAFAKGWDADAVRAALSTVEGLVPQDCGAGDCRMKVSVDARDPAMLPVLLPAAEAALAEAGLRCDVIASSTRHLDVLPRGMNKGSAVRHAAATLGVPLGRVITVGVTGNDRAMLTGGACGVVVADRASEMADLRTDGRVYVAGQGGPEGLVEGVRHHLRRAAAGVLRSRQISRKGALISA